MPVMTCQENDKSGYKYGESGKCYTYTKDSEASRKEAKRKAILQGTAIEANSGEKLKLSKEDLDELCKDFDVRLPIQIDEPMIKSDENNCIFGWAYAREDEMGKQVVDHSGDFCKEENWKDMELATYAYNLAFRQADMQHDCVPKGYLVESMVFTKEKMEKMGLPEGSIPEAVWMGFFFPDDKDYEEIKKMKQPMFSLYGSVTREIVDDKEV